MRCIDDKPNGIILNHHVEWNGEVRIAWYIAGELCEPGPGPIPPSLRECWCSGPDLVAGRFTAFSGTEPPIDVITRAVALAVETYLRSKLARVLDDDLFIRRGKL